MLELLNRNKEIRDLLDIYPTKDWDELIPLIIEIGISFLKKNYSIVKLNLDDLRKILHDMDGKSVKIRNKEIPSQDKKLKTLSLKKPKNQHRSDGRVSRKIKKKEDFNNEMNLPSNNYSNTRCVKKPHEEFQVIARKASGDWRKGDDSVFRQNSKSSGKLIRTDTTSREKSPYYYQASNSLTRSPSIIKYEIYPKWWGDGKSEDEYDRSRTKSKDDYKLSKAEVYVPDKNNKKGKTISFNRNYSRSNDKNRRNKNLKKMRSQTKDSFKTRTNNVQHLPINHLYQTDKNVRDINRKLNLERVESKIKSMVLNDKSIHNQIKKQQHNDSRRGKGFLKSDYKDSREGHFEEWKYNNNLLKSSTRNFNDNEKNFQRTIRSGVDDNNKKVDYLISYDKNLKPEMIREKSHEKPSKTNKEGIEKRKIIEPKNLRNLENSIIKGDEILNEPQTAKFKEEEIRIRNEKQNENANGNQSKYKENNYLNPNLINKDANNYKISGSKRPESQLQDKEILSSYAPSERTLNMFQREYSKKYSDYINNKQKNVESNYYQNRNEDSLLSNISMYPHENR